MGAARNIDDKPGGCLVTPPRLERGTYSLEGCCSILLSYGAVIPCALRGRLGSSDLTRVLIVRNSSEMCKDTHSGKTEWGPQYVRPLGCAVSHAPHLAGIASGNLLPPGRVP